MNILLLGYSCTSNTTPVPPLPIQTKAGPSRLSDDMEKEGEYLQLEPDIIIQLMKENVHGKPYQNKTKYIDNTVPTSVFISKVTYLRN